MKPSVQQSILFPDTSRTFADFFCGCGGLSLGFIQAGLKCISAMDIAPDDHEVFIIKLGQILSKPDDL